MNYSHFKKFEAIIFDMDGVLLDSEPIYRNVQDNFFAELGVSISKQEYHEFIGLGLKKMWQLIKDRRSIPYEIPELIAKNKLKILNHINNCQTLQPYPHVADFLRQCDSYGLKTAVASSTTKEIIIPILTKLQIIDFFDLIVSGEEVKSSKPAPDIFWETANRLQVPYQNCLVIEDSENGVAAAKSAGMFCLGFNYNNASEMNLQAADFIVTDFKEIKTLIAK